jgi:photosystem II stability/assembly factor-like uncharacterized protein
MTPEERELRRALDARSATPSPEFRASLRSALETGRPVPTVPPAFAIGMAAVLAVAAVGVLLFAGQALHPRPTGPAHTSPAATPTPAPTPPQPVPGVLVTPPNPIVLPGTALMSVPSSDVVWVLMDDQYLYRSTDRGATWVQRPMPPAKAMPLPEVSFVNGAEGWLSTPSYTGNCSAVHTDIWHTTDAGSTWALLGSTGIADVLCKRGLSFVDPLHGFLGAWGESQVIYRTSDGGMTWSASQPLPDPPGITHGASTKVDTGPVQAFGSTLLVPDYGNNGPTGVQAVFHSTDGGATWTYLATAPNVADTVAFVSASRWVQLIGPGQSVETTDSGATWHQYASEYSQAAPIAPQIVFGDTMVGYATVRGEIQRTVDGGLTWTAIKTPGT